MADAGGVRAGRAYVEIGANDSALRKALASAQARLQSFGRIALKTGAAVAALGAAGVGAATTAFVAAGSALNDLSARTGASVEGLSALGFAAKLSGTNIEAVEAAFRKSAKVITEAGEGSASAADALARLGLTARDLQGLSPDQQFQRIATAINAIQDPTTKAAAAMGVFGKSGMLLLPMIADMDALTARARELGIVMSAEDVAAADALGDAFDTVTATIGGLANAIGATLAPSLTVIANAIADVMGRVNEFARSYQEAIQGIIIDGFAAIITAAVNWRTTLSIAFVTVELAVVRLFNQIEHLFSYGGTLLVFFAENWQSAFYDLGQYTKTVINNLYDNLLNFFNAIASWLEGEGFNFEWTGLENGFVRTLKKLPELAAREMGPLEAALQTELDALTEDISKSFDETKAKVVEIAAAAVKPPEKAIPDVLVPAVAATKAAIALKNAGADRFGSAGALAAQGRSQQEQRERKSLQIQEDSKRLLKEIERRLRDMETPQTVKI